MNKANTGLSAHTSGGGTPANTVLLEGARLSYPSPEGEIEVLRGIDLQICAGEIVAVMGPSGSGKSSLIAAIGGLELATGGRVMVLGHDITRASEMSRTALRRRNIGIVFQSYHLVPAMTAQENAALPLMLSDDREAMTKAAALLTRVGLGHRLRHRPSALSGGEQQRVAIARAFVSAPKLVLADEPTGNLDQATGKDVTRIMFDLVHESGSSLVLVTHDEALARLCQRTIRIDNGRIVEDAGKPAARSLAVDA